MNKSGEGGNQTNIKEKKIMAKSGESGNLIYTTEDHIYFLYQTQIDRQLIEILEQLTSVDLNNFGQVDIYNMQNEDQLTKEPLLEPVVVLFDTQTFIINKSTLQQLQQESKNIQINGKQSTFIQLCFEYKSKLEKIYEWETQQKIVLSIQINFELKNIVTFNYGKIFFINEYHKQKFFLQNTQYYEDHVLQDSENTTFNLLMNGKKLNFRSSQFISQDPEHFLLRQNDFIVSWACLQRKNYDQQCHFFLNDCDQNNLEQCQVCNSKTGVWSFIIDTEYKDLCKRVFYDIKKNQLHWQDCQNSIFTLQFKNTSLYLNQINSSGEINLLEVSCDYQHSNLKISWIDRPRLFFQEMVEAENERINQQLNNNYIDEDIFFELYNGVNVDENTESNNLSSVQSRQIQNDSQICNSFRNYSSKQNQSNEQSSKDINSVSYGDLKETRQQVKNNESIDCDDESIDYYKKLWL